MLRLNSDRKPGERGYTMIELAIVIAIVAIIGVLTIPSLSIWIARMRLRAAEVRLERTISMTKKMSVTNRMRYCVQFTSDTNFSDGNSDIYNLGVSIFEETAVDSGVWTEVTSPVELGSWSNDNTTELYKSISLESDPTSTTAFTATDGCTGLLFNNFGWIGSDITNFAFPCGGNDCAILTLRNKAQGFLEQRTLWIDRGGNVRISPNPATIP